MRAPTRARAHARTRTRTGPPLPPSKRANTHVSVHARTHRHKGTRSSRPCRHAIQGPGPHPSRCPPAHQHARMNMWMPTCCAANQYSKKGARTPEHHRGRAYLCMCTFAHERMPALHSFEVGCNRAPLQQHPAPAPQTSSTQPCSTHHMLNSTTERRTHHQVHK